MSAVLLAGLLALSSPVLAQDTSTTEETPEGGDTQQEPWRRNGWGFGGLPAAAYSSDDGLGGGIIGSIYRYDGLTAPYKAELYFLFYVTTKGVQTHRLQLDLLNAFDTPLRITTRADFSVTNSNNYCGYLPPGDCSLETAEAAAEAAGFSPGSDDYETFVGRYYKMRVLDPSLFINVRYKLKDKPHAREVFGTYLASYQTPGNLSERDSYPGSLYAEDFPDGEEGFVSRLQAGYMWDNRDNEPSPIRGYWSEVSLRGAHRFTGSSWDYFGWNATHRAYTPLGTERVVLADRLVLDGMVGEDIPTSELVRAGGSQIYWFFGGQRAGRGVRSRRVMGRVRTMNQTELRATVWSPVLFDKLLIDVTPVAFLDMGYWAWDWDTIGDPDQSAFVYGTGAGMRLAFNKNFIIRVDAGFSPFEDYNMQLYIDVYNLW